ncbi:MAG: serine hydrolase [Chloroflexota bacterium]|nr:serine hydrolase [Chloroflexota bacterium]
MTVSKSDVSALRRDPARLDEVFAALRGRVVAGDLPAAGLAVGDGEGAIRTEATGEGGRPLSTDTNFFLASITKPIIATAFMELVEDGAVGLHDPVARWVPGMDVGDKARITPWHVLTHTSGVVDTVDAKFLRRRQSAAQMTREVIQQPLRFEPGARWEYNSASFYLLTAIIERVTGMTYVRYLAERLCEPLGIHLTFDPRGAGRKALLVHGVGVDNGLVRYLVVRYLAGVALPGGGLFGSLADLAAFGAALVMPRPLAGRAAFPLRLETVAQMGADQTQGLPGLIDGEERSVHAGLGWAKPTLMRDVPGSASVISHGGASGGRIWIDPEIGLVFVFLTNRWEADRGPEIDTIRGVYEALGRP